jgi:23S rRNA (adenine2030-N6)-methyltransferase
MNYRHDFHAGNFADVFKHIILTRILLHLCLKPAAFRYIDTHAGSGIYDLSSAEARKTAEWQGGIGKLLTAKPVPDVQGLVEPYLRIVVPLAKLGVPQYAGSAWIAKALLRRQDRMLLCELHPRAFSSLKANLGPEPKAKLFEMDGYMGLRAFIPPVERRGLVLIDPPFEEADEFQRACEAVEKAWRKWATGIYMLWFPVKDTGAVSSFVSNLAQSGIRRVLRLEFQIDPPTLQAPLARCGVIVINPPFRLEAETKILLPWLARSLGDKQPGFAIERLSGE